jgi:ABC-type branched-subunit amino acid transport system substrate-binding protein
MLIRDVCRYSPGLGLLVIADGPASSPHLGGRSADPFQSWLIWTPIQNTVNVNHRYSHPWATLLVAVDRYVRVEREYVMEFLRRRKNWKKPSVAVAGLGLSALLVSACSSTSSSSVSTSATLNAANSSKGTFQVLGVIDTSGNDSAYGPDQLIALQASVAYWNAHGGIGGEHVALSYVNGNSDPVTAVTSVVQWVSSHGKPNLIYDGLSADDAGMPAEIKRLGVLSIGQNSAATCDAHVQQTCPTQFVPIPLLSVQETATAAFMKQRGYKKVGLLVEEDEFSQSEISPLLAAFKADGITTVTSTFPLTAVDVTPEVSQLTSSGVNAIWGAALGPAAGYIISARSNLGLVNKLPLVFDPGAGAEDLTKLGSAAALQNAYETIARPQDPNITLPGRSDLLTYAAPYGKVNQPLPASIAWDSLVLAHDAASQAGSVSTQPMINALINLSKTGQDDPLYMYPDLVGFTESDHEDVLAGSSTYEIVKVGPLNAQGEVASGT